MTEKRLQSLAGYIREHIASIEQKLAIGVKQEAIVSDLEAAGFKTTLANFRNELYRVRGRIKKNSPAVTPQAATPRGENKTAQKIVRTETTAEDDFDLGGYAPKKTALQKHEEVANRYVDSSNTNPLLRSKK